LRQCGQVSFGVAVGVIGLEELAEGSAMTVVVGIGDLEVKLSLDGTLALGGAGWMTLGMLRNAFPISLTLMCP